MAILAKLDENNNVVNIENLDDWRATDDDNNLSETTARNHLNKTGFNVNEYKLYIPGTHVNMPSIGGTYDSTNNQFIKPKPYSSWVLNTSTWQWDPPSSAPYPADSVYERGAIDGVRYFWNDTDQSWDRVVDTDPE